MKKMLSILRNNKAGVFLVVLTLAIGLIALYMLNNIADHL